MGWSDWESTYARVENEPIDKFKNKSRLLKAFGPNAVRIYNSLDGGKKAEEVQSLLSIEQGEFANIMDFMLKSEMIVSSSPSSSSEFSPTSPPSSSTGAISPRAFVQSSDSPPPDPRNFSPMEKQIYEKYGELGLKVYALIDGERTAEQILNETGITETKLVEMLEFMNEKGIIKLEKPGKGKTSAPPYMSASGGPRGAASPQNSSAGGKADDDEAVGFKPMAESRGASETGDKSEFSPDLIPVDVPIIPPLSLMEKTKMSAILNLKFSKSGPALMKCVDNAKDYVQLSIETGFHFSELDRVFTALGQSGLMKFRQLNRAELRHRYGDDGLSVYKRFGREGILIYQLIGKSSSLGEIIKKSGIEKERAIDIIIFVHKMLGLDIPLDRETIYRYISQNK